MKRKLILKYLFYAAMIAILSAGLINLYIYQSTQPLIHHQPEQVDPAYTGILLGSLVYGDGKLSYVMKARADLAIQLYHSGKIKRILVSGDHGTPEYDEVNDIRIYLEAHGIPTADIFLDHAGFNTYDSMVRAKRIFQVDEAVVITQEFHLPRALFIAERAGISATGAVANLPTHLSEKRNEGREFLARVKSFGEVALNLDPHFLGEQIPITGNSRLSYDQ